MLAGPRDTALLGAAGSDTGFSADVTGWDEIAIAICAATRDATALADYPSPTAARRPPFQLGKAVTPNPARDSGAARYSSVPRSPTIAGDFACHRWSICPPSPVHPVIASRKRLVSCAMTPSRRKTAAPAVARPAGDRHKTVLPSASKPNPCLRTVCAGHVGRGAQIAGRRVDERGSPSTLGDRRGQPASLVPHLARQFAFCAARPQPQAVGSRALWRELCGASGRDGPAHRTASRHC